MARTYCGRKELNVLELRNCLHPSLLNEVEPLASKRVAQTRHVVPTLLDVNYLPIMWEARPIAMAQSTGSVASATGKMEQDFHRFANGPKAATGFDHRPDRY